jgi:hypothetical protein
VRREWKAERERVGRKERERGRGERGRKRGKGMRERERFWNFLLSFLKH